MYKKFQYTIYNILFLCVAFGLLFFVKLDAYADVVRDVDVTFSSRNGTPNSQYGYTDIIQTFTFPENIRACLYLGGSNVDSYGNTYYTQVRLFTSQGGTFTERTTSIWRPIDGSAQTTNDTYNRSFTETDTSGMYTSLSIGFGTNSFVVSPNSGLSFPVFTDFEDARSYIINGYLPTKPFDEDVKLDSFRVYSKGEFNLEFVQVRFNSVVVKPIWSNPDIIEVEVSIYALDPSFNYNPRNYTYSGNESGQLQTLDISGLTLHGQKFIVRATPYTATKKGVSIAYELEFPENFEQPIGQLVITEPNHYPYSTTIDISGNDVPIEWTVTQTPIYIYETNNVENYYYGEPVSYPVPEITENTTNNYYEEYINNYYNDYSTVVNNYETNFDIDITDVSSGDIQNTYDDIGNFFKGFGGFVGKLALLFNGLFPFLSPSVSVVLVTMVGIIAVGGVVILFLKIFHIL